MSFLMRNILSIQKHTINCNRNVLSNFPRYCSGKLDPPSHKVDTWERRFLVWTGKYKSVKDVPDFVSQGTMERARNRMRIKISNIMIAATAIGCIIMILSGKKAAREGETVQKASRDWHKQLREEGLLKDKEN